MAYCDDIRSVYSENLPWKILSGANILVVGATGLIGSCLVEMLMLNPSRDYKVFAGGRNEDRAKGLFGAFWDSQDFAFVRLDVSVPLDMDVRFDYIIDAASNASPNFFAEYPVEVIQSNVLGVSNLIRYGLLHGMKRFLYVSSGEVYGQGDGRVFTEDYSGYVDCMHPRSCYPSSKRAAETLCVSYASEYGADVVIVRPCHIYGPNYTESDNRVYAQFLRNALRGEDIILKSDGLQYRSWCYVVDCARALLFVLLKGKSCEAYNIADPNSNISIRELAHLVAKTVGRNVVFQVPEVQEAKMFNPVVKSVYSIEKMRALGWSPRASIEQRIKEIVENKKDK